MNAYVLGLLYITILLLTVALLPMVASRYVVQVFPQDILHRTSEGTLQFLHLMIVSTPSREFETAFLQLNPRPDSHGTIAPMAKKGQTRNSHNFLKFVI